MTYAYVKLMAGKLRKSRDDVRADWANLYVGWAIGEDRRRTEEAIEREELADIDARGWDDELYQDPEA